MKQKHQPDRVSTSVKGDTSKSSQISLECEIDSGGPLATAVYWFWKSSLHDPKGKMIYRDAPACAWVACSEGPNDYPQLSISDPDYFTKLENLCNVTQGMAKTNTPDKT